MIYSVADSGARLCGPYPSREAAEEANRRTLLCGGEVVEIEVPFIPAVTPEGDDRDFGPVSSPKPMDRRTLHEVVDAAWDAWERRELAAGRPTEPHE